MTVNDHVRSFLVFGGAGRPGYVDKNKGKKGAGPYSPKKDPKAMP
jgi:hypothetical protein